MIISGHRLPPSRSHSRQPSRAASPALSTRSRKSVMSLRNGHRHSYADQQLTGDDSSDSDGYLENFQSYRNNHQGSKSLRSPRRSLKNSPHQSFDYDDDSETFATQSQKGSSRNARANSLARSMASHSERRPRTNRLKSESTQDSGSEMGTRALVQAKIREKVAQQSSMDESSSDFWKPKSSLEPQADSSAKTVKSKQKKSSAEPQADSSANTVKTKQEETASNLLNVESKTKTTNGLSKESENPNKELTSPQVADDMPVGPPPKTPNYEWECEFCTFTNEANTKICAMCCKTPTKPPVRKGAEKLKKETEASDKNKGKTKKLTRKISFWPGTKTK